MPIYTDLAQMSLARLRAYLDPVYAAVSALADKVSTSRTINGHALTADVTVTKSDVGLGSVDNVQQMPLSYLDDDPALSANSNSRVASQAAAKAYMDALIAAANGMVFKAVIDCSASPNYPAADAGHVYVVSVAGKLGGASGANVELQDMAICLVDGSAAGTQAAVGPNWAIIQRNLDGAVTGPASSVDGHVVVFSGATGKIIADGGALGTAAFEAATAFATAAQGTKADNALQKDGSVAATGNLAMGGHAVLGSGAGVTFVTGDQTVDDSFADTYAATGSSPAVWTLVGSGLTKRVAFAVWRLGTGDISFVTSGGATVWFAGGATHTKIARQGAPVTVILLDNTPGSYVWGIAGVTE